MWIKEICIFILRYTYTKVHPHIHTSHIPPHRVLQYFQCFLQSPLLHIRYTYNLAHIYAEHIYICISSSSFFLLCLIGFNPFQHKHFYAGKERKNCPRQQDKVTVGAGRLLNQKCCHCKTDETEFNCEGNKKQNFLCQKIFVPSRGSYIIFQLKSQQYFISTFFFILLYFYVPSFELFLTNQFRLYGILYQRICKHSKK